MLKMRSHRDTAFRSLSAARGFVALLKMTEKISHARE
jgi:hypothetical protein